MTERAPSLLCRLEEALLLLFSVAVSLSIAGMEFTFLPALALRLARWQRGEAPRPPALYLAGAAGLLAAWVAASALAASPAESFPRVVRLYHLLVPLLLIEHAADPRRTRRLLAAYALGVSVAAIYGLADWMGRAATSPGLRLEGTFSTAMTSGNVMAVAAAGLWTCAWQGAAHLRLLSGGGAALAGAALLATFTRSSWLGALSGALVGALWSRRRTLALAVLLAVTAGALLVPATRRRAAEIADRSEYTARGRISLWRSGWEAFRERPILGFGLADHTRLIAAHRRADATFEAGHYHSNPVQIAVATGTVGVVAYAFFHAVAGLLLWRRRASPYARAALAAWLAFHVSGFFDWSFGDAEVTFQYFWWVGIGLGASAPR